VLLKRVTRDLFGRIIKKELLQMTAAELNKVQIGQRREGSIVDVSHTENERYSIVDEVIFLSRPEYPFKLSFKDMLSRADVIIEDESVNCHTFTTDPEKSQKFMLVCSEYILRKSLTIGKQSTLMPFYPLLPHILSLIFSSKIEYLLNAKGNRYKGIKFLNYDSYLNFDYVFTSEDAKTINKIRRDLADMMGNLEIIKNFELRPAILEDIKSLLEKPRLPINIDLPDWRHIINWQSEVIPFEPDIEDQTGIPIPVIDEDSILYLSETAQREILSKKMKYLKEIEGLCHTSLATRTELICIECSESLCEPEAVTLEENDPPLFEIFPQYGKMEAAENIQVSNQFISFVKKNYDFDYWEICRNKHVIAWNLQGSTFISDKSPVAFRLPGGKIVKMSEEIWKNEFYELKLMAEKEKNTFSQITFKYECLICDESFKKNNEFFSHLQGNDHKRLADIFLQPYISNF
jgi:hypothetical protein